MDVHTFLRGVLGDCGYYCIWAHRQSDKKIIQKLYTEIDAVAGSAAVLDGNGFDTYFALGTFKTAESRKVENVSHLRSFFVDLDCGPTKAYATQVDALSALRTFCKDHSLPRPTVVNSGRGIHAYWPLQSPIEYKEWKPIAERFKAVCMLSGLVIDPAVPADGARVLRVPGTHNYKDDPPGVVQIVGSPGEPVPITAISGRLGAIEPVAVSVPAALPVDLDPVTQIIAGSFTSRFRTILQRTAAGNGCAHIKDIITNRADISEPMWRAGLSIAKFCIDGDVAIHKISAGYPNYTKQETEHKASLIKGPYLCKWFSAERPGVCEQCQHWGKIRSPISIGKEVAEATDEDNIIQVSAPSASPNSVPEAIVIPKYPNPYFRGKNGGIWKRVELKDGDTKDVLVYINDLYVVRRVMDSSSGEAVVMRLHLPRDGIREFTLPLTVVSSKDDFRKSLAAQGVALLNVADLMDYTMKWVTELQFQTGATEARRQFGWTDSNGTSFVLGNLEIYKDRVVPNPPAASTSGLFPAFAKRGSFEAWKELMTFFDRPGMELHQFMIGLSFGSVLMEFQPINAAAFHVWSKESGLGKTTAMYAGASVWGNPDIIVMQERDTYNSKMNRAEVYKNVVGYLDEMTNSRPQDLSDWAYQLPSGMQRNRLSIKGNVERVRGEPWKMLFGSTGNTSMIDRISSYKALPQAEAQRILEYEVKKVQLVKQDTDALSRAIKEHYGHAAVPYIQYVMNNLDAAKELADTVQRKMDTQTELDATNRFWSALVSRTLAGLMLAKKAGLIQWKLSRVAAFAVELLSQAKIGVKDLTGSDPQTILADYLAEHYNSMLRIRSTDITHKESTGIDHLILPEATPRGNQFVARYEYDIKKLFLVIKPFKEWCSKQQLNYNSIVNELSKGPMKALKSKARIGRGTHFNSPPTSVIVLYCDDFMSDDNTQTLFAEQTPAPKASTGLRIKS
jgi:hypothetical protein